jgi:tetratricopeptide (TPR) repeat protein
VAEHRPNSLRALGLWAAAEGDLSDALLLSEQPKEALACATKSLQVLQRVSAAHPEDVDYRGRVAHAYYRTAVGWMRLGDRKAALGEFQKSLAIRQKLYDEQPDATLRLGHQAPIMLLLARCGDHAGAAKVALALKEYWLKKKENGVHLSEIASCFALCLDAVAFEKQEDQRSAEEKKLRQHYLELALETFRQAQTGGFTDVLFVDYDPDVDPLRGIPAFEEWRASFKRALKAAK